MFRKILAFLLSCSILLSCMSGITFADDSDATGTATVTQETAGNLTVTVSGSVAWEDIVTEMQAFLSTEGQEETPENETLIDDSQTDETTTDDSQTGETTTDGSQTGETTTDDSQTGETSTGDSQTGETTTDDSQTGETTTDDNQTGETSTGDSQTGETTTDDSQTGDPSTDEVLNTLTASSEDMSVMSVTVTGDGDGAVIEFPEFTYFDYDVTFDQVELKSKDENGRDSSSNSGTAGAYAWLFAQGHKFITTDTVTTTKNITNSQGTYDDRLMIFGGSKEAAVTGDTYVELNGGDFHLVSGGGYDYSGTGSASVGGTATVYVGPKAMAEAVVGGCVGGVNTGDIYVTYASQKSGNVFVAGSSADANIYDEGIMHESNIANSAAKVENPSGSINVTIAEDAQAGAVHGVLYSNVTVGSINITNNGTAQELSAVIGSTVKNNVSNSSDHYKSYGVYPGADYYSSSAIKNYQVKAALNITNNGTVSGSIYSGYYADITGDVTVAVNGSAKTVYGGTYMSGDIDGNVSVNVSGTVTGTLVGGNYTKASLDTPINVTGSVSVMIKEQASVATVFGAGYTDYSGSTYLQQMKTYTNVVENVNIQVKDSAQVTGYIYGAGFGCTVGDSSHNYEETDTPETGNVTVQVEGANVGVNKSVYGGGNTSNVYGDCIVRVGKEATVSGAVYGGCYSSNLGIAHNTYVYIEDATTVTGSVYGGSYMSGTVTWDTNVFVSGSAKVEGNVYGGYYSVNSSSINYNHSTNVTIKDTAEVAGSVYGGNYNQGDFSYTNVTVQGSAQVAGSVYGDCGKKNGGAAKTKSEIEISEHATVGGDVIGATVFKNSNKKATITVKDQAQIKGTIYGKKQLSGRYIPTTTVIFDGASSQTQEDGSTVGGSFTKVADTDLVQVTNNSDVTIDNEGADDEQLVTVTNLTIDKSGKLTLKASAAITGAYTGDGTGTLAISAGKKLAVGTTVNGKTDLSILDAADGTVPEAEQVYVTSGSGSTTESGDYTWVDTRDGLALAWKQVEATEATDETEGNAAYSQWWLVKSYSITYDANGGSGEMTDEHSPYVKGDQVTVLDNRFERQDYTFTGWNTQADGKGTDYEAGNTFAATENVTLYAQWSENTATITYEAIGGGTVTLNQEGSTGGSKAEETVGVVTGTVAGATAKADTGYYFVGWYDNADCKGTPVGTAAAFAPSDLSKEDGKTYTYYAKFSEKTALAITVIGNSDTKVYNGEAQSVDGYTIKIGDQTVDTLPDGVTVTVDQEATKISRTDVGETTGELTESDVQVTVTDPYSYTLTVKPGTLKITEATVTDEQLKLEATGYSDTYDGQSHPVTATLTGALKDQFTLYYSVDGGAWTRAVPSITNVGKQTVSVKAVNFNFNEVVLAEPVVLEVTPAEIVVTPTDLSKTYGDADPDSLTYTNTQGVNGETPAFTGTLVRAEGEKVGKYAITQNTLALTDGTDGFLAKNYKLTVNEDTFTIKPKNVTLNVTVKDRKYDGTKDIEVTYDSLNGVIDGDDVTISGFDENNTVTGTVETADVGNNKAVTYGSELKLIGDKAENYNLVLSNVTVNITKRNVTLTSATDSKTYDGTALTNQTVTETGDGFVTGEGYTVTVTGTITNAGETYNTFTYALNAGTSEGNYDISTVEGTLTVNKATLNVTVSFQNKTYDGDATVAVESAKITNTENVYDTLEVTVNAETGEAASKNAGNDQKVTYSKDNVTLSGAASDNYKLNVTIGTVNITKRSVTLTSKNDTKPYDGTALTKHEIIESGDGFLTDEGIEVTYTGTQTQVGSSDNTFTYEMKVGTLPDNYTIATIAGKLTVTGSVTYHANGGSGTVTDENTYAKGDTVTVSENGFTRAGYVFAGWNTEKDGSGDAYSPKNTFTFGTENVTLYAQWTKLGEITISPVSMEAYVGGESANSSHAPKLRFSVTTPDGVNLSDLTFYMNTVNLDGTVTTETMSRERIDATSEDTLCLFPLLDANMNSGTNNSSSDENDYTDPDTQVQRGDYLKLVDDDGDSTTYAGVYTAQIRSGYGTDWYITAMDASGNIYTVSLDTTGAVITIREVSAETNGTDTVEIYETPEKYLTTVVTDVTKVTAEEKAAGQGFVVVAKTGTNFRTNGDTALGLFGENMDDTNVYVDKANAKVSLLVDDTVALKEDVTVGALESAMLTYAQTAAKDEDSTLSLKVPITESVHYDFKYLDLVNAADGNAVVTTDQAVTIYWPYPDGITYADAEKYTFQVLHFSGLDRTYEAGVSNGTLDLGSNQVTVENVDVTPTEYGLKFEASDFSPFVLLWAKKCTLTVEYVCTSGDTIGKPAVINIGTYEGATESVAEIEGKLETWTDHTYGYSLYADSDMTERIESSYITVTGDTLIYAGYTHQGGNIGSIDDETTPTTTKYTLTYVLNNGADNATETYNAGTTVTLTKQPAREGYTFTGWYADEALTQKVETVTMNKDTTVYAGWQASTVPDMLSGDDHFAYIVGYEDGTVRPGGNITRAEVATIFFRLLKEDIRNEYLTSENPFDDVSESAWYCKAVSTLTALGIIEGRSETIFAPNEPITRAELATVCARFDTGVTSGTSTFTDIAGHWAEAEIQRAAALGWIEGYDEDGTFRPDRNITRAEAITMINRVLCRIPKDENDLLEDMNTWPDNENTDAWYYLAIQEATNSHDFRHKGEINETWTELQEDPDWEQYEK